MANCSYCNKEIRPGERFAKSSIGELYHDGISLLEKIRSCYGRANDYAFYTGKERIEIIFEGIFEQVNKKRKAN